MTTTTTCLVCGATEEPAADRTCPVCGAELPTAPPDEAADAPVTGEDEVPPTTDAGDDEPVEADAPDAPDVPTDPTWSGPAGPTESTTPPPPSGAQPPSWPTVGTGPVPPPPPGGGTLPPSGAPAAGFDPSHPSGIPASMRTYGMLTHLSAFAGAIVALAFVGPLVMWLIRRDEHPFLDHHGKEALNFNLSLLLYGVIGIVGAFVTVGIGLVVVIPAAIVFFFTWVITTIVAAVKANNGEGYRYPLTIRFIGDDV